jgi:hypothetical protein
MARVNHAMSRGIWGSLKQNKNGKHWETLVGYTLVELKLHLEKQFKPHMNWDNWGSCWEIDHKTPKSWFVFNSYEDIEFKQCWELANLQPLEKHLNRQKYNRFKHE